MDMNSYIYIYIYSLSLLMQGIKKQKQVIMKYWIPLGMSFVLSVHANGVLQSTFMRDLLSSSPHPLLHCS